MNARTIVGGIVGGVVLFTWSFISHVLLPLGEVGIQSLPNEAPVVEAMRANITAPGFYFIPGMAAGQQRDEAAMKEWEEKAKKGPVAILIYQVTGEGAMSPKQLGTEFASNVLLAIVAAFIVSNLGGGFGQRMLTVMLMGLVSGLDVYVSYWNWYRYPTDYTLAVMSDQLIGFLLMGAAIAAIVKKQSGNKSR